jgi:very-short-patch-repair endonuclease
MLEVLPKLKLPEGTSLEHLPDGNMLATLKSGIQFTLTYLPSVGVLLTEESFVDLAIAKKWDFDQMAERITRKITLYSRNYYKAKYREPLLRLTSERLAAQKIGNKSGRREVAILIPKEDLEDQVKKGMGLWQMEKHFGLSAFLIRRNLQHYGMTLLQKTAESKVSVLRTEGTGNIERISPDLVTMPFVTLEEKRAFISKAYEAYLHLLMDAWYLKDTCSNVHRYIKQSHGIHLEEISWSPRRYEVELALSLMDAKIPFWREYPVPEVIAGARADFGLIGTNIIVEIDGDYHETEEDARRDGVLTSLGYRVIRFKVDYVSFRMKEVMDRIMHEVAQPLPASARIIKRLESGTLK